MLPLDRAGAPVRSTHKIFIDCKDFGAASRPGGSRLPRHNQPAVTSMYVPIKPMAPFRTWHSTP
ncbi:hypothetical protein C1X69_14660 [Pseudomonas sp. FW305-67]|nr:hypothetical protein C1X70_04200 [Pseudomonas sp. FW305-53]PMY87377.1 hypothetical protein C1X68_09815 [Pseudomonas sp. FW303-C2]PMY93867.1 hypothetical protein C1X67_05520 [Pseudomonas sp. FW305-62]PNA45531.1 hypothetical protein C1X71_05395 [Pseudomonas sp. FW306-2-2C-A10BC]PNA86962.1 hypothetical protein C1X66_10680 [Pseudomonas sp. MPR-R3B]PNB20282.1 hypothetical protein C1X69_14660 [Pseudomonas sp. FW305-67]